MNFWYLNQIKILLKVLEFSLIFFEKVVLEKVTKLTFVSELTFQVQISEKWWAYQDLNLGPHPYQGCTLTS